MQVPDPSDALISGGKILGTSPREGAPLSPIDVTPPDEIVRVVATAREAPRVWLEHPPRDCARRLEKLRPLLLERACQLAAIMAEEQGKSVVEAYASEIMPSADLFPYWAAQAPKLLVPVSVVVGARREQSSVCSPHSPSAGNNSRTCEDTDEWRTDNREHTRFFRLTSPGRFAQVEANLDQPNRRSHADFRASSNRQK
ncbi:MAG: aldehyde dehydrogenase family protein [Myxococcota bacterium]